MLKNASKAGGAELTHLPVSPFELVVDGSCDASKSARKRAYWQSGPGASTGGKSTPKLWGIYGVGVPFLASFIAIG